jgi:hypothetical protein
MKYFQEAKKIWKDFVPSAGQADTVQGELLRAVEKLRYEAIDNGNGNWDDGFHILLSYLESHLLDPVVFAPETITSTREILTRLADFEYPVLDDEPYDELGDRVVEYFQHYGTQPHVMNPALHR